MNLQSGASSRSLRYSTSYVPSKNFWQIIGRLRTLCSNVTDDFVTSFTCGDLVNESASLQLRTFYRGNDSATWTMNNYVSNHIQWTCSYHIYANCNTTQTKYNQFKVVFAGDIMLSTAQTKTHFVLHHC